MINSVNLSGLAAELSQGSAQPSVPPVDFVRRFADVLSSAQLPEFYLGGGDFEMGPASDSVHPAIAVDQFQSNVEPVMAASGKVPEEPFNPMTAVNVIHLRA